MNALESVDFEEPDGENIRLVQSNQTWKETAIADLFTYGFGAICATLIALAYLTFYFAGKFIYKLRLKLIYKLLLDQNSLFLSWLYYFMPMVGIALVGALIVMYEPAASGSGMPEVIANLNGIVFTRQLNFRVFLARHLGLICIICSGLYAGYDGPFAYSGLLIAVILFGVVDRTPRLSKLLFADKLTVSAEYQEDLENVLHINHKRFGLLFSASGAAAGIAASFHAPIGGAVFALEEAISFFNPTVIIRTLFTSLISYIIVGSVAHYDPEDSVIHADKYALFPNDGDCKLPIMKTELLEFALLGFLAGIIGHIYNKIIIAILRFKIRYLWPRPFLRLLEIIAVCLITSLLVILTPQILSDSCKPFSQALQHLEYITTDCRIGCGLNVTSLEDILPKCLTEVCISSQMKSTFESVVFETFEEVNDRCVAQNRSDLEEGLNFDKLANHYNPPANLIYDNENLCYYPLYSLLFGTPDIMLRLLFSRGSYFLFDLTTLSIFSVIYLFLSVITHNVMMPTDLVLPNIILGAALGRLFGVISNIISGSGQLVDPGTYALLGAAALWSGTSRIAMTIAIIMLETTFDFTNLPAILIVVITATIVGNWFGASLYHMEMEEKKFPYLPDAAPNNFIKHTVKDLIADDHLIYFHRKCSAKTIYRNLSSCSHQGFPVVEEAKDSEGRLYLRPIGIILRSQLRYKFLRRVQVSFEQEMELDGSFQSKDPVTVQLPRDVNAHLRRNPNKFKKRHSVDGHILIEMGDLKHSTMRSTNSVFEEFKSQSMLSFDFGSSGYKDIEEIRQIPIPKKKAKFTPKESFSANELLGFSPVTTITTPKFRVTKDIEVVALDEWEQDEDLVFDLSLLMTHPVHSVPYDMSARKAYSMFRNLGLRHLCVVDDRFNLVGFISRKDFVKVMHDDLGGSHH